MTTFQGLDVNVVEQQGRALKAQAQQLDSIINNINGLIAHLTQIWHGHDAQTFEGWWHQQHRPALTKASHAIDGLGQSALNNASEQSHASSPGGGTSGGGAHAVGMAAGTVGIGAAAAGAVAAAAAGSGAVTSAASGQPGSATGSLSDSNRTWQQVQQAYTSNAGKYALGSYGPNGEFQYQCTAWANYRWRELGYQGPLINGYGNEMAGNAGGSTSTPPSLGAMASYGTSRPGHVMIVEQVSTTSAGAPRIRVSEMNIGADPEVGLPDEYSDTRWWDQNPDGTWTREGAGGATGPLTFATFRKK